MRAYRIRVTGDVQGVFYRYNAKIAAKKFKVTGWIKNKQDGSVESFIQGSEEGTKGFINWANEGSPMSTVEKVEITAVETDIDLVDFKII